MTLKGWLKRERQPDRCGINARAYLKQLEIPNFKPIHRKINLRAIDFALNKILAEIKAARGGLA